MIVTGENAEKYPLLRGEWLLIPAAMPEFVLAPVVPGTKVLEVYIGKPEEKDSYVNE